MQNIVLIGFMGVGKGTIARELSKESEMFAVDTDDLIESLVNKKIKAIFEDEGEEYFRELEKRCALWLEKSVKGSIISTGGGFYRQKNIKKIGKIIYLKSSFEAILQRIKSHPNAKKKLAKRPLLQDIKKAKELYAKRVKEYEKIADVVISVEDKSIKTITKELLKQCRGFL